MTLSRRSQQTKIGEIMECFVILFWQFARASRKSEWLYLIHVIILLLSHYNVVLPMCLHKHRECICKLFRLIHTWYDVEHILFTKENFLTYLEPHHIQWWQRINHDFFTRRRRLRVNESVSSHNIAGSLFTFNYIT